MAKNKFKIDDILEVVKYGFLVYQPKDEPNANGYEIYNKDDEGYSYDIYPEWIGLVGRVIEIHDTPEGTKYSLSTPGDPRRYYEDQLKKVNDDETI